MVLIFRQLHGESDYDFRARINEELKKHSNKLSIQMTENNFGDLTISILLA